MNHWHLDLFSNQVFTDCYVWLPIPSFAGGFIATIWIFVLYFFSSVETSPFIYFQF